MSINKVFLLGKLGKDPDLRYTPSGTAVCTFPLATTNKFKDKDGQQQEKTEWHNIVVWAGLAKTCGEYLHKGKQIYCEGRIQNRSYEDREGNKRYISEIIINNMQMLGRTPDSGNVDSVTPQTDGFSKGYPDSWDDTGTDDENVPF